MTGKSRNQKYDAPAVLPFEGYYICRHGTFYRVKTDPSADYSIHHGHFNSPLEAEDFIRHLNRRDDRYGPPR